MEVLWLTECIKSEVSCTIDILAKSFFAGGLSYALLWEMFSSTLGLYPLEANSGSQHAQNIQTNKVIGESEKCLLFYGKN